MKGKWDLKSIITLILIIVLAITELFLVGATVFGLIYTDDPMVNSMTLLFSNSVTMILTFYFTKKDKDKDKEKE